MSNYSDLKKGFQRYYYSGKKKFHSLKYEIGISFSNVPIYCLDFWTLSLEGNMISLLQKEAAFLQDFAAEKECLETWHILEISELSLQSKNEILSLIQFSIRSFLNEESK
jgi:hypothetical protein